MPSHCCLFQDIDIKIPNVNIYIQIYGEAFTRSGPILESEEMLVIFQEKGRKMSKRAKYLKIWAKCTKFENILKKAGDCVR